MHILESRCVYKTNLISNVSIDSWNNIYIRTRRSKLDRFSYSSDYVYVVSCLYRNTKTRRLTDTPTVSRWQWTANQYSMICRRHGNNYPGGRNAKALKNNIPVTLRHLPISQVRWGNENKIWVTPDGSFLVTLYSPPVKGDYRYQKFTSDTWIFNIYAIRHASNYHFRSTISDT